MGTTPLKTDHLVREARVAVRSVIRRSHQVKGWELLQERDAEGTPRGALPYTDAALAEFDQAHKLDPNDVGVVHHLAIGHHARAWDLELAGDPRAAKEWERALGYWSTLGASREFWAGLWQKLAACDPDADASVLDAARRDLLEDLLDLHVDFVRYHCELGRPERAGSHVELVKRARIPPAVKKRLIGKVFEAMTSPVAEAQAAGAYASALTCVERFLDLFPDPAHVPALRMHAELTGAWLSGLSYQDDWAEIVTVGARAERFASRLAAHPELEATPLAVSALEELTGEMALRAHDRGMSFLSGLEQGVLTVSDREAAAEAFEVGMTWGRFGQPHSRPGALVGSMLAACLYGHAVCLHHEAAEVVNSNVNDELCARAGLRLCRQALAEMEESVACAPDEPALVEMLDKLRSDIGKLEGA